MWGIKELTGQTNPQQFLFSVVVGGLYSGVACIEFGIWQRIVVLCAVVALCGGWAAFCLMAICRVGLVLQPVAGHHQHTGPHMDEMSTQSLHASKRDPRRRCEPPTFREKPGARLPPSGTILSECTAHMFGQV